MAKLDSKIAVLMKIRDVKHILFGQFSDTLTKEKKVHEWKRICEFGKARGLIAKDRDFSYTRDVFWSNIKRATLAKKDNANKTGSGGGKTKKITPLDNIVMEIIGEDSPILEGLEIRDTMASCSSQSIETKIIDKIEVDASVLSQNIRQVNSASCSSQNIETKKIDKIEVDASVPSQNIRQVNSNNNPALQWGKKYKRSVTSQSKCHEDHEDLLSLKRRKLEAQLEFVELQNYKMKLEIYEMEEWLNISHSDFTDVIVRQRNTTQRD